MTARPHEHVSRALLRLLDDLATLPALIASDLNVVLAQDALADALLGEQTGLRGYARSCTYRWFTDPTFRARQPVEDHEGESRAQVEDLRLTLRAASPQFTRFVDPTRCRRPPQRSEADHPSGGRAGRTRLRRPGDRPAAAADREPPAPGSEAVGTLELIATLGRERFDTAEPRPTL